MNTNWIFSEPAYESLAQLTDLFLAGLLVLAAAGVLVGFMRRMPAAARHLVWAMSLGLLLLLPLITSFGPEVRLDMLERPEWMRSGEPVMEGAWVDVATTSTSEASDWASPFVPQSAGGPLIMETESTGVLAERTAEGTMMADASGNRMIRAFTPYFHLMKQAHWSIWILSVWGLGVVLIIGWSLSGFAGVWWITRRAKKAESDEWIDLLDELADRLLIYQSVRLLVSPSIASPMTWGIIRPVVLLPIDADDWAEDRRRSVLLHELAHIKRGDSLVQFVAQLGCALHWINPLAWHALKKMRMEQEKACDDLVLVNGTRASDYASHLLAIARSIKSTWASPLNTVSMAKPSLLEGRVVDILDPDRKERGLSMANGIGTSILALAIMLPLAALTPWQEPDSKIEPPQLAALPQADVVNEWTPPAASPAPAAIAEAKPMAREVVAESPQPSSERSFAIARVDTSEEGKRARAKAIRALREALNDEDADMRKNAAMMLAEMGDKGSTDTFINLLKTDPDADVRRHALFGLGDIRSEEAMEAVIEALEDREKDVRRHAVMLVADYHHPEATGALLKLIDDDDPDVRRAAVIGLSERGGENVADALLDVLDDPNADVRRYAIMSLAEFRSEKALPAILEALADDNAEVRRFAVMALTEYDESDQIITALRKSLKDPNADVRRHALMAIGEYRDVASLDLLIDVLENDKNSDLRQYAAMALGEIGDIKAVDALTAALKDKNKEVRRHAAFALSNLDYGDNRNGDRDEEFDASVLKLERELEASGKALGLAVGQLTLGVTSEVLSDLTANIAGLDGQVHFSEDERAEITDKLVRLARTNPDDKICDLIAELFEDQESEQARSAAEEMNCEEK